MKRMALRRARNISISQAVAGSLPVASTVIENPFDETIFRNLSGTRERDLVFVGRLVSDKGADILLSALQQLRQVGKTFSLTIVGDGPERDRLVAQAQSGAIADRVQFVGSKRPSELVEILNQHKVMVVPSRWPEPFGIVALEGIASGCAVIGSAEGGLPEAIGPCGVTFPNGDVAALARQISELMNPARPRQLLDGAPAHLAKFHRKAVAERYLRLLQASL